MATPAGVYGKIPYRDRAKNLPEMDSATMLAQPVGGDQKRTVLLHQSARIPNFATNHVLSGSPRCPSAGGDSAICSASAVICQLIPGAVPQIGLPAIVLVALKLRVRKTEI